MRLAKVGAVPDWRCFARDWSSVGYGGGTESWRPDSEFLMMGTVGWGAQIVERSLVHGVGRSNLVGSTELTSRNSDNRPISKLDFTILAKRDLP